MIRIRLSRGGSKNDPSYRIVAIEKSRKRDGKSLDVIGYWHPHTKKITFDKTKYSDWLAKGALPSQKVKELVKQK